MIPSPRRPTPARRQRPTGSGPDADAAAATVAGTSPERVHPLLRLVAVVAIVALALRVPIQQGLEVGHVVAVLLAPLWLPRLARYRGGILLAVTTVLAVGAGLWLTAASGTDHVISRTETTYVTVMVLGALTGIGVLLWARTFMRDASVAVWFGVGLVLGVNPASTLFASNPWKFGLSVPVAVLLLAVAWRTGSRWAAPVVLLVLVVLAGLNDARSELAILLLVLLVVLWQMRPVITGRRGSVASTLLVIGGLALVVFQVGQALILEGYLGEATRQRTETQLDESGSIIAGGRPELGAALALFRFHPWGFGAGTFPNLTELGVAKAGMASLNYDPDNGYVENYLFGEGFELHSVMGDLWTRFGLAGILLTLVILVIVLVGAARGVARRTAAAVLLYVVVKTLWNVPFSPLFSSIPLLMLAIALCLVPVAPHAVARGGPRTGVSRGTRARNSVQPARREPEIPVARPET